jgi:hypothetical protein
MGIAKAESNTVKADMVMARVRMVIAKVGMDVVNSGGNIVEVGDGDGGTAGMNIAKAEIITPVAEMVWLGRRWVKLRRRSILLNQIWISLGLG